MAQVTQQAVADVDGRGRDATQRHAQRDARGRGFESLPRLGEQGLRQDRLTAQTFQRQACIPERAAHVDVVTHLGAGPQQRLAAAIDDRHLAKDRNTDV